MMMMMMMMMMMLLMLRIIIPWKSERIPKVLCQYLYYWLRYRVNNENSALEIMPTDPKLTQVPRVILDIFDALGRPKGSYAEIFVSISLLLAEI